MDKYGGYADLERHEQEGRDYRIRFRKGNSGVLVIAPHGGLIEPGTSQIADEIAGSEHTFYCLEGLKMEGNYGLHISSAHFDEPACTALVRDAWKVLSVHGTREPEEVVYIGGLDEKLRGEIQVEIVSAGFLAMEDLRSGLRGKSRRNICNRCTSHCGVQLEISSGLRKRMLDVAHADGQAHQTRSFYDFTSAVRRVLARTVSARQVST